MINNKKKPRDIQFHFSSHVQYIFFCCSYISRQMWKTARFLSCRCFTSGRFMYNFKLINLVFILNLKYSLVWSENEIIMHSQKKNWNQLFPFACNTKQNNTNRMKWKKMSIQGIYLSIKLLDHLTLSIESASYFRFCLVWFYNWDIKSVNWKQICFGIFD